MERARLRRKQKGMKEVLTRLAPAHLQGPGFEGLRAVRG